MKLIDVYDGPTKAWAYGIKSDGTTIACAEYDKVADSWTELNVFSSGSPSAIERIVSHSELYRPLCSTTIRTARSRTSWENLPLRAMTPILSRNGVSGKPGAIQSDSRKVNCLGVPPATATMWMFPCLSKATSRPSGDNRAW